jgi:hypothetical protein
MNQVIENSVYTLRRRLNTLKQDAHRIEERLKLANEQTDIATAAERLAKQCYYLTSVNGRSTSVSCTARLAQTSSGSNAALSVSIMVMAERATNLRAQNAVTTELAELDILEQQVIS